MLLVPRRKKILENYAHDGENPKESCNVGKDHEWNVIFVKPAPCLCLSIEYPISDKITGRSKYSLYSRNPFSSECTILLCILFVDIHALLLIGYS